jgi:hypothetical protein
VVASTRMASADSEEVTLTPPPLALRAPVSARVRKNLYFFDDCRRTISLIQIGAKGEVHPLDTG